MRQAFRHPGPQRPARRRSGEVEDRVALAGKALVKLDHRPPQTRIAPLELRQGVGDGGLVGEVLEARGHGDAGLAEDLAAAALGAEPGEVGVAAIDRNAQPDRERAFRWRNGKAAQMRRGRVRDQVAQALDQAWPLEDLLGQRAARAVVAGEQMQPGAGVGVRHPGEQAQIVVDRRLGDRLAGDEDEAGARQAQQEEHAEHALLVMVHAGDPRHDLGIEAEARQHDDGARCPGVGDQPRIAGGEGGLQFGEARTLDAAVHRSVPFPKTDDPMHMMAAKRMARHKRAAMVRPDDHNNSGPASCRSSGCTPTSG